MVFKLLSLLLILLSSLQAFSQAKKPTIMVVPADNWCIKNNYSSEMGGRQWPDYRKALQNNSDLLLVIGKINSLMAERGFPLKNLESVIKNIDQDQAENSLTSSKSGASLAETPLDRLKRQAQADIIIQINWTVNTTGPRKSVTFNMQGLDSYTDKQIAGAQGTGQPSYAAELPLLLEEAVLSHLDNFNAQLQLHFEQLFEKGREITLTIQVFDSWGQDLETEVDGSELSEIIEDWLSQHAKSPNFNITVATENQLRIEQVRIPMVGENNRSMDARQFIRELQKDLRDRYQIPSKLTTKGLGQAGLILGDK